MKPVSRVVTPVRWAMAIATAATVVAAGPATPARAAAGTPDKGAATSNRKAPTSSDTSSPEPTSGETAPSPPATPATSDTIIKPHGALAPLPSAPVLVTPEMEATLALERARAAYEYGDMEMVVDSSRLVAEGRSRPTSMQRVQALRFLGIGLYLTQRPEGAEAAFFELLRQKPDARLDPTHTRPDVVAFFEGVRARHASEIQQARPSKYFILALLPPLGQFQNGDRGRGITFAAIEVVTLGLAIGTYAQLTAWRDPTGNTFGNHTDDARSLKLLNNVSVGIFAATVAVGIIDGVANYYRHTDDNPPLAWLTPNGLGFRF